MSEPAENQLDQLDQLDRPGGPEQPDDPDQPTLDPDSAWLAAYALGLAYSETSQQQRVHLLREVTRGQPELLDGARERLESAEVIEPDLRDRARRLLVRARTLTGIRAVTLVPGSE